MDIEDILKYRDESRKGAKADIIMNNPELKKEVLARIDKYKMSTRGFCNRYDVDYDLLKRWLNTYNPFGNRIFSGMQWDYLILCRVLGLEVRIVVIDKEPMLDGITMDIHKDNIKFYEDKIRKNNEKFFKYHEEDSDD
jgi:hypothetical protein